ncbi:hypothetical protein [Haloprofundus marisrubri]|uniref:hypothetical protein n=1 Tax=Haloprofundus marisrubri TaxID=1514971 RepID=UPI001969F00F|nr:hypothetical protein [Haloprofundus marisrubri]
MSETGESSPGVLSTRQSGVLMTAMGLGIGGLLLLSGDTGFRVVIGLVASSLFAIVGIGLSLDILPEWFIDYLRG